MALSKVLQGILSWCPQVLKLRSFCVIPHVKFECYTHTHRERNRKSPRFLIRVLVLVSTTHGICFSKYHSFVVFDILTVVNIRIIIFWDVKQRSLVEFYWLPEEYPFYTFYSENRGSIFLQNIVGQLPDYTALHSRKHWTSYHVLTSYSLANFSMDASVMCLLIYIP